MKYLLIILLMSFTMGLFAQVDTQIGIVEDGYIRVIVGDYNYQRGSFEAQIDVHGIYRFIIQANEKVYFRTEGELINYLDFRGFKYLGSENIIPPSKNKSKPNEMVTVYQFKK